MMMMINVKQDTVMLGADYYETEDEVASLVAEGRVPIGIGENTKIKYKKLKSLSLLPLSKLLAKFLYFLLTWSFYGNAQRMYH